MSRDKGKRKRSGPKEGLFDDLEALDDSEIKERLADLRASLQATEKEQTRLQEERQGEITLVQSLRAIQESTRGISKERNALLNQFRKIREKALKTKLERDEINQNVPPPLEIIQQRLAETHRRLATIPNDLSKMPNREHEVKLFSFFFELQAMHVKKKRGNELHQEYIEMLRNQEDKLKQLDKLSADRKSIAEEAREEVPDKKANPKEIKKLNERIGEMLETIRKQRDEIKKMRREMGRLEAYERVRKKSQTGARKDRKIGLRLDELKSRASSGGSLSLEDFSALLNSGGLDSLTGDNTDQVKGKTEPQKPKKRRASAARGRRRTLNSDEREKRRG